MNGRFWDGAASGVLLSFAAVFIWLLQREEPTCPAPTALATGVVLVDTRVAKGPIVIEADPSGRFITSTYLAKGNDE